MDIFIEIGRFLYDLTLKYGVIGLAIGAFFESLGVPTASAVIDLTSGLLIINKRTTFIEALIVADLGLVAGSLASYYAGRAGASVFERFKKHPATGKNRQSRAQKLIEKYGDKSIFFGQLFGPARTWISFPAGAMGMDVKKFTIYTALGGAIYLGIIISLSIYFTGFITERLDQILAFLSIRTLLGLVAMIILLIFLRRWLLLRRNGA
ncbi:MAG TPA: DedA family protein [Actinobacteria bacterium]|nr:DedA family protein [Actinomycetota bacterium]